MKTLLNFWDYFDILIGSIVLSVLSLIWLDNWFLTILIFLVSLITFFFAISARRESQIKYIAKMEANVEYQKRKYLDELNSKSEKK